MIRSATIRRYVHGPGSDEPLVQYEGFGTRNWLHADERGSIVALSDAAGNVTAVNRYDEYGVPAQTNAGLFQYTGQVWLGELGVYSYKARMYQPSLGRFLQPDPIGYGDGMNMYAYVGGDPVNFTDPEGAEKKPASAPSGLLVTGTRRGVTGGAARLGSRGARPGPTSGPEQPSDAPPSTTSTLSEISEEIIVYGRQTIRSLDKTRSALRRTATLTHRAISRALSLIHDIAFTPACGCPANTYENAMARDAKREAERKTRKKMSVRQEERFHDNVTGQNLTYHQLVDEAVYILNGQW